MYSETLFITYHIFLKKDLCSSNGTYLNGEYIGPASEEASEPQARQLKTGDVLRFGKLRTIDGELIKPIEAKLTIQYPPSVQVEGSKQPPANYTPCEGQQLEQTAPVEQRHGKRFAPSSTISKPIKGKDAVSGIQPPNARNVMPITVSGMPNVLPMTDIIQNTR
uniref:FHA domain-containing protein n=1 Tax=Anopheles melas TaxID=34690 RepID=A0A182TIA8_9DIPT